LNHIVQLYDGIISDVTSIVVFVSTVPRNLVGFAVDLTVVPGIPSQLSETTIIGGIILVDCLSRARQSNTILHMRVASRPSMTG